MSIEKQQGGLEPVLYIVATPIGNLGDLSERARAILSEVDLIAAEDTRHSSRLLQHCGINTRLVSYHDYSQQKREDSLLAALARGERIALVSDAGTPLISDPGYSLVRRAREQGFAVRPVPGACALTAALSVAGLPSDRFVFEGFAPARHQARLRHFESLLDESRTLIFYESPHRIVDCMRDLASVFGPDREAVICRELTKVWESVEAGSLAHINDWLQADSNNCRGEFVVLLAGAAKADADAVDPESERVLDVLLEEVPVKQAAALAARITGGRKNALYRLALDKQAAGSNAGAE